MLQLMELAVDFLLCHTLALSLVLFCSHLVVYLHRKEDKPEEDQFLKAVPYYTMLLLATY